MSNSPTTLGFCPCRNCVDPNDLARRTRERWLDEALNRKAFALFCADLDAGRPTKAPEEYRAIARGDA